MELPEFRETREVRLDTDALHRTAVTMLTPSGFRVETERPGTLELIGPGMTGTKQDPIVGCSKIRILSDGRSVTLEAELGGVRFLSNFVRLFPLLLTGGLLAVLSIVFWFVLPNATTVVPILSGVLVVDVGLWLVLGPVIARSIEQRTRTALGSFLTNLISVASRG